MNRGFVVLAFNTPTVDYIACARLLAHSIKQQMPSESISLITDKRIDDSIFDEQVIVDSVDTSHWKLSNDWLVYEASPYQYTIKVESDIYIPRKIDWWWEILKGRDLSISTTIRDYQGKISQIDVYRQMLTRNNLPDTYNALTYFKRSTLASEFYNIVRDIFDNWSLYSGQLQYCTEKTPTTDTVYGIAAQLIGREHCTLPVFTDMSMVHMKPAINGLYNTEWHRDLIIELSSEYFRINTWSQLYPVHYHVKSYAHKFVGELNGL